MIKKIQISLLLFLCFYKALSQNFETMPYLGNGISPYAIEKVLFDSVHNKLIVSSKYMNYAGGKKVRGICSWDGTKWDSLSSGINTHDTFNNQANGTVLCGIPYNGKLLVGGSFQSIGGVNATSLATWDGAKWDSLSVRAFKFLYDDASISGIYKFNNKLYLYGSFDTIQGQSANSIATFDGNLFQPITIPVQSQATFSDMKFYKGELYVSGNFSHTSQSGDYDILRYDGNNWISVGGGIKGGGSSVGSMAIYNNELYVGGYFYQSSGNAGNVIMKWDGNNWHDVGWGNNYQNGAIWQLLVHQNKLYAFGSFEYTANLKSSKVAVFDGTQWCAFADSLDERVFSAEIYHDSIYIVGAFKSINTDTAKRCIAKIKQPMVYNTCVNVVGIKENINDTSFSLFPNPTTSIINIDDENNQLQNATIQIQNYLGQLVFTSSFTSQINLSNLSAGMYFLTIEDKHSKKTIKIIKE